MPAGPFKARWEGSSSVISQEKMVQRFPREAEEDAAGVWKEASLGPEPHVPLEGENTQWFCVLELDQASICKLFFSLFFFFLPPEHRTKQEHQAAPHMSYSRLKADLRLV